MIFLRVGWMTRYQGNTNGDSISGGGAYVAEHGYGHEVFNFKTYEGILYGYVQPVARKNEWRRGKIDLTRLGASEDSPSIIGVLAVWVATSPTGGAFIVGWYKNATVYRTWQPSPPGSGRRQADEDCGYYVTASAENAVLLPPDERVFSIPQQGKGAFGQSNIWYADDPASHREFRLNILRYIESGQLPNPLLSASAPHQPDPLIRQRVEKIAIEMVTAHFTKLGYIVNSVERDNVGWDLNAAVGKRDLKLEVKGLSGRELVVELTPNEYVMMMKHQESYRVCVVTNALTTPHLDVFAFSPESKYWETSDQRVLNIQEIIAARCSLSRS